MAGQDDGFVTRCIASKCFGRAERAVKCELYAIRQEWLHGES
jgi:hypothetical protein